MKKIHVLFWALVVFSQLADDRNCVAPAHASEGTIQDSSFYSSSLSQEMPYRIYLPPGYFEVGNQSTRYPVLYLLHGHEAEENYLAHTYWTQRTEITTLADSHGMMIVFPEGLRSWYSNYHNSEPGTNRFEDYIVYDLIEHIDATYRTRPDREGRGITGNSMGGHGAMKLAARHPDRFCAAASLSGLFDLSLIGVASVLEHIISTNLGTVFGPYPDNLLYYEGNSSVALASNFLDQEALGRTHTYLHFNAGLLDHYLAAIWAVQYARVLDELGLAFDAAIHTGDRERAGHTWTYWGDHIDEVLTFISAAFETPPARPQRWRYRTIEPTFQVWGWSVTISRTVDWAWIDLIDVDEHGFSFVAEEATHGLSVETPSIYTPGTPFKIVAFDSTGKMLSQTSSSADPKGSLQFTIEIGGEFHGSAKAGENLDRTIRVRILEENVQAHGGSGCGGCGYAPATRQAQGVPKTAQLVADLVVFLVPAGWLVILLRRYRGVHHKTGTKLTTTDGLTVGISSDISFTGFSGPLPRRASASKEPGKRVYNELNDEPGLT